MPNANAEDRINARPVPFGQAFRFWLKLGFISFGGPAGQIAIMHRELVDRRKWITEEEFLHALNFCMLLPGPEAQQLATYNGWRLHGVRGGLAAGILFVLPSIFFLLALSYIYAAYGGVPAVAAVLDGVKPVVVAIVVEAVARIGRRSLTSAAHVATAIAAFVLIQFANVPFPLIVAGAAALGLLAGRSTRPTEGQTAVKLRWSRPVGVFGIFFSIWVLPLAASAVIFGRQSLAVQAYLFFTKAAFVTFGGAYAVLAYVNQAAVESGWITAAQAVDGLALAETTPGPLIMVLQFVGYMAGWQNPAPLTPGTMATVTAVLTTIATFLPSLFLIFAFAPYVEALRANRKLSSALTFVTAAVVGVILTLALTFGSTVLWRAGGPDWIGLLVAALAVVALVRFHTNVLIVIAAGGILGLARYLLQF